VCPETSTVLRAVEADFFFNCWYLLIHSDNRIRHIPRCVHYHAQGFQLETLHNFYVGSGNRTPELYSVTPESDSVTLQLSVSQYVLVSSPLCGPLTRYCFLFKSLGLEFAVLSVLHPL
jgi:hypothetical protein